MKISIVSVFTELYGPFLATSLLKRAQENGIVTINTFSFFDMVAPKEHIDAPTFGPGAGMLIKPIVVERSVDAVEKLHGKAFKIFFSPHGKKLTQSLLKTIVAKSSVQKHIMLFPARYEGMDARVEEQYADEIVSVGDFVLMGGDIPAMMFLEGLLRLIPGIVGKKISVAQDSFSGPFVDYPEYTEPVEWHKRRVPDVIRSGNHEVIETWRKKQAAERTVKQHFSWLRLHRLDPSQKKMVSQFIPRHYVGLMHDEVLIGQERIEGTTSVMSIDIHDIARSSATYGIENFFVVTPLMDQQKIVRHFLSFWQESPGAVYNHNRHTALKRVKVAASCDEIVASITKQEGKPPLIIATSARLIPEVPSLAYDGQTYIWQQERPVLFLFGTGNGLSDAIIRKCDYILSPLEGIADFNHLSVRSAVGIVLDRWLGLNNG